MDLKPLLLVNCQKCATQWYAYQSEATSLTIFDVIIAVMIKSDIKNNLFQPAYTYVDGDGTVPAESAKVTINLLTYRVSMINSRDQNVYVRKLLVYFEAIVVYAVNISTVK